MSPVHLAPSQHHQAHSLHRGPPCTTATLQDWERGPFKLIHRIKHRKSKWNRGICSKWQNKAKFQKKTKWWRANQPTWKSIQSSGYKDAHQTLEKNGWVQGGLQQREKTENNQRWRIINEMKNIPERIHNRLEDAEVWSVTWKTA